MSNAEYESKAYFAMSLDPIHIGTGGYRLGRVDNTIVRESGTNLPKIPGSSIEGNARTYAYYREVGNKDSKFKIPEESCALGKELNNNKPCGICPVCVSFGYTGAERTKLVNNGKGGEERISESLHGMAQFSDARILFFPVHSMIGPVWVTCPSFLKEVYEEKVEPRRKEELVISKQIGENHELKKLNLGWLYLDSDREENSPDFTNSSQFKDKFNINDEILERVVVVHDDIFEKIVNSNLEVRTSVSIDPRTGAAEEGALFTYEAIPRATILWFNVVFNQPENFNAKLMEKGQLRKAKGDDVERTIKNSFELFETLGIGGMQTRGFGRLRILNGG